MLSKHELRNHFGTWPLAYIPYGGADFGEIAAIAQVVSDGDRTPFYESWIYSAARPLQQALKNGQFRSARELFLRASAFYARSYHPLYGEPVIPAF